MGIHDRDNVFDTRLQRPGLPQPAAVEHASDERRLACHPVEYVPCLRDGEHRRYVFSDGRMLDLLHPGQVLVERLRIEEQ
jgi:hypothetical protein